MSKNNVEIVVSVVDDASKQAKKSADNIKKSLKDIEKQSHAVAKAQEKDAKAAAKVQKEEAKATAQAQKEQAKATAKALKEQAKATAKALKEQAKATAKAQKEEAKATAQALKEEAKATAQAQQEEAKKTDQIRKDLSLKAQMYSKRLNAAKKTLSIRSERDIQAEIRRTQQSYQLLARSGKASAKDLSRAWAAQKKQIHELNAEMGKMSVGQKIGAIGRGVTGIAAGVTAGAMVLREPVRKEMTYDRSLAMVANTAFSQRDVAGRIAGKKELHESVKKAVETGGGTKEDALGALNAMLASGTVKADTAMNLLPTLQKAAVATGASTDDLAQIAISSMQQMGISEDQIGVVLDKAVAAGQVGNFELADMARWLPQQMAAAKSAGMSGMEGFEALLVANQQARVTAGTSDEAGNNLVNLLAKITSKETNQRFKNLDYKDPKTGNPVGIDLVGSMENYKAKGINSLDAFNTIVDDVVGNDADYQKLKTELASAKEEDRLKLLEEMTTLVEGTAIGQIISDRQALMGLLGIRNNTALGAEVKNGLANAEGAVNTSHQVIADTNDYKTNELKTTVEMAQLESMKVFNDMLGSVSKKLTEYAAEYPNLTVALAGTTTGIVAIGAAAAVAAISLRALGGRYRGGIGDIGLGDFGGKRGGNRYPKPSVTARKAGIFSRAAMFGATKLGSTLAVGVGGMLYSRSLNRQEAQIIQQRNETLIGKNQIMGHLDENGVFVKNDSFVPDDTPQNPYQAMLENKERERQARKEQAELRAARHYNSGFGAIFGSKENEQKAETTLKTPRNQSYTGLQAISEQADFRLNTVENNFNNYQADFQAFGEAISEGLKQAISGQEHIIKNLITVELDGRLMSETVVDNVYSNGKRG